MVARTDAVVSVVAGHLALLNLVGFVDTHGDVCRLGMHVICNGAGLGIEAHLRPNVADITHNIAHDGVNVDISLSANLAHHGHNARGSERLDGATHLVDVSGTTARRHVTLGSKLGFFRQNRVEDSVRHLVA